jgi:hypothetical protein
MAKRLTQEQAQDATRLKTAIKQWQAARKAVGLPGALSDLGIMVGGITQPMVSMYANGKTALNARALELFSSALGVNASSISPGLAARLGGGRKLHGFASPGMVYAWPEFVSALRAGQDSLPDVCSVESPDTHLNGFVRPGDVLIVSRLSVGKAKAGDGVIIRYGKSIMVATYYPHLVDGWFAKTSAGEVLYSVDDDIDVRYLVEGMPTVRWSRMAR